MSEIPKIRIGRNVEEEASFYGTLERFLASAKKDLEAQVLYIAHNEDLLIGQGQAARVFSFENARGYVSPCRLCLKAWRDKPRRERSLVEYKQIQWLSPEEEFNLQDDLFRRGCKVPRPIAFGSVIDRVNNREIIRDIVAMEEIPGYDLQEIIDAGAKIVSPSWRELTKVYAQIKNEGVVHRDLKPGNIMLKTDQPLLPQAELKGELYIIDFGVSRHIIGNPTEEDFVERIGTHQIRYPADAVKLEALAPHRKESPFTH